MSPLKCFRNSYWEKKRLEQPGRTFNSCSRAAWEEVRAAWAALPVDHPDRVEAEMSAGVSEALSRQRRQAATMRQEAPQLRQVVGPMDPLGTSPMTSLPLSSAHFLGALPDPSEQSSANVLAQQTRKLVQHSEWPVAMSLVSQQVSTSSSLVDRIKCTQRDFWYIARERRSFGRMQYVRGCKGLCDNAHGAVLKRIQTKIVAKLEWLLKQAKASQALLRCTVGGRHYVVASGVLDIERGLDRIPSCDGSVLFAASRRG